MKRHRKIMLSLFLICLLIFPLCQIIRVDAAIKLNKQSARVGVGSSIKLRVIGTTKKVTWSSSKPSIASVNSAGKVTGKKMGKTVITAKVGTKKVKCKVKVVYDSAVAAKKIDVTYKRLTDCILAICKNRNSYPVAIEETMKFSDAGNGAISTSTDSISCLGAGQTCVLYFPAPKADDGSYVNYAAYQGVLTNSETSYTSYSKKIAVNTSPQAVDFTLSATNNSGHKLNVVRVSCLIYDGGGNLSGYVRKFLTCYDKNANALENVPYPENCFQHDNIKVYVDCAY